jgi:hypothetical protein
MGHEQWVTDAQQAACNLGIAQETFECWVKVGLCVVRCAIECFGPRSRQHAATFDVKGM